MPEIKTEMLSITGMRWYMATALGCSSMVVDTMSWRGMATHVKKQGERMTTFYRTTRHRLDGPAIEYADGYKVWYVDDKPHRVDGPAIDYPDGYKSWYVQGIRHRVDGPAVEYADGRQEWWVAGVRQR